MHTWRARGFALVAGLSLPACSIVFDTSGLTGSPEDSATTADGATSPNAEGGGSDASPSGSDGGAQGDDASSQDATSVEAAVAGDSATDAPFDVVSSPTGNLLTNWSFDLGVGVCGGGWGATGDYTSYDISTVAHTPTKACKLCGPGRLLLGIDQIAQSALGEQYLLEAWVQQDIQGTAGVVLGFEVDTPATTLEGMAHAVPMTWGKVETTLTIDQSAAGKGLRFFIGGTPSNGVCVLIDDVSLSRL